MKSPELVSEDRFKTGVIVSLLISMFEFQLGNKPVSYGLKQEGAMVLANIEPFGASKAYIYVGYPSQGPYHEWLRDNIARIDG